MTVLVTGDAGYIGSHMVHALLEAGEQPVVLNNLTTGFDSAVPAGATLIAGDAGDQSRVALIAASNLISQITSRKRFYRDSGDGS
jgi:UDP-glucose 4-epimerase